MARIYSDGIAERIATFETEPWTAADVLPWIDAGERLPLLVAEEDGSVVGWVRILAYATASAMPGSGRSRSMSIAPRGGAGSAAGCSRRSSDAPASSATGS